MSISETILPLFKQRVHIHCLFLSSAVKVQMNFWYYHDSKRNSLNHHLASSLWAALRHKSVTTTAASDVPTYVVKESMVRVESSDDVVKWKMSSKPNHRRSWEKAMTVVFSLGLLESRSSVCRWAGKKVCNALIYEVNKTESSSSATRFGSLRHNNKGNDEDLFWVWVFSKDIQYTGCANKFRKYNWAISRTYWDSLYYECPVWALINQGNQM